MNYLKNKIVLLSTLSMAQLYNFCTIYIFCVTLHGEFRKNLFYYAKKIAKKSTIQKIE